MQNEEVLIYEDNKAIARFLGFYLTAGGHTVIEVADNMKEMDKYMLQILAGTLCCTTIIFDPGGPGNADGRRIYKLLDQINSQLGTAINGICFSAGDVEQKEFPKAMIVPKLHLPQISGILTRLPEHECSVPRSNQPTPSNIPYHATNTVS